MGHWCSWTGGRGVHSPSITTGEDGNNEFKTSGARGGSLWAGGDSSETKYFPSKDLIKD